jgi:hypothetical protein
MPDTGEGQRLDPVVAAAMIELTDWTYHRYHAVHRRLRNVPFRRKGLHDSSSRSGAIHMLKSLKYHGYPLRPDELHKWAIGHGWKVSDARELSAYAEGIRTGQRYHTAPDPFGRLAIDKWKDAAAGVD